MMLTGRRLLLTSLITLLTGGVMSGDSLARVMSQPSGPLLPMGYRQGTVLAWNPVTLQNTVEVAGAVLTDLPVLGVAEAASIKAGSVVGLMVVGSTFAIIGRLVRPNTAEATDAITLIGQRARTAVVATQQSTTSATFVDLATVGPVVADVLVPASGKILVTLFCNHGGPANSMSPRVTGATTIEPSTQKSLAIAAAGLVASATLLYEGLPAGGLVTFTAKYRSNGVANADFSDRTIIVQAL